MNRSMNKVLVEIQTKLASDSCAHGVTEQFFHFMDETVDQLRLFYGMGMEAAFDFVGRVATEMHGKGLLPPFPRTESSDSDISRWLSAAMNSELKKTVLQEAQIKHMSKGA